MYYKEYEKLRFQDDFIFGKVMRNKKQAKKLLETLLGTKIEGLEYLEIQKRIKITYESKEIFLDLQMLDEEKRFYDVEMQNLNRKSIAKTREILEKRSRYYHGLADLSMMERGKSYTDLQQSYIIFICTFDPFGRERYRYTFESVCKEEPDLWLLDGRMTIFYNIKGDLSEAPEELKALLYYIRTSKATDEFTKDLETEIRQIKGSREWRAEYMKELALRQDDRREGELVGERKTIARSVDNAMRNFNIDLNTACEGLGVTVEEYRKAKRYRE